MDDTLTLRELSSELFESYETQPGIIESATTLPIFIGRGTQEDDRAINAKDLLTDAGYDVTFFEYDGGHFFPDEGLRAVESWMREIQ